jgi:molybdopterin converting factor small subunit
MNIKVHFYSYFKDFTGCAETFVKVPSGSTLGYLHQQLTALYPRLDAMGKSTLMAVGVEYQGRDYVLNEGDEVSLFPPVQGG